MQLPSDNSLLFAYGTLKRGGDYHYFLKQCHSRFIGIGHLVTPYPLLLATYPCLLDLPGKGCAVEGEVFQLMKSRDWKAIDALEGYPEEYTRRIEQVSVEGKILSAWTYFYIRKDIGYGDFPAVERFPIRREANA